ncbi:MAG: transposase IS4 family protein [Bacteroidetes bacterium OLB9]|nr:MAG: transposase IS4 family protein [Bacteroidetes bacterium OLB9]
MHNIKANFDKILHIITNEVKEFIFDDGNFEFYPRKPKMSDCEILALSLCAEAMSIDSENYFWGKIKSQPDDFPNLIDRSNYNRRRRKLISYHNILTDKLASILNEGENVFIVDSMPIPVCNIARAGRSDVLRENFKTSPDKGYSAITKTYFYGYKLHLITSLKGVYNSIDITKASVHDVQYLGDVKHSKLNNCTLIGDKGYISSTHKTDLFHTSNVRLETPNRRNQADSSKFPYVFFKNRKRIETQFSQLTDQFLIKRNYAKTFLGLCTRIWAKLAGFTILQFLNHYNGKPLNNIKYALL